MLPGIFNRTPFSTDVLGFVDVDASQHYLVVLSASFTARPGHSCMVAEEQHPINAVDVHFGAPGRSSVRYDSDVAFHKPFFDVIVNGAACAPDGIPAEKVEVGIHVAGLRKTLVVSGDRTWTRGAFGVTPSKPAPFVRMPLQYERAFGGSQGEASELRNPVGIGFDGATSIDPQITSAVPNVESPESRVRSPKDRPVPVGFGVIGRGWLPRLPFGGTYDEGWKTEQFPLLPRDFNPRFFQAAPADQQLAQSVEGRTLTVLNMTPDGRWSCRLPTLSVPIHLRYGDRLVASRFQADTLVIEPDVYGYSFKARVRVPVIRNRSPLQEVVVGHAPRAWWRARVSGKEHLPRASDQRPTTSYFAS